MIGIDTNILVRYFLQDDPEQSKIVTGFFENKISEENPAFINIIILCELVWVLEASYKIQKQKLVELLEKILITKQFIVQSPDIVWLSLSDYKKNKADFSDCLIGRINQAQECAYTVSFDDSCKKLESFKVLERI